MNQRESLIGKKPNKCNTFVLPMCEINYNTLPNNFINCYLSFDKGKDNYQIVTVFHKFQNDNQYMYNTSKYQFDSFLEYIENNRNYAGKEEEEDEIILYFNIPERNKRNYELFLAGKYSKFSEDYKKLLCSYYGTVSRKIDYRVHEYDIIYPTQSKIKQIAERLFDKKDVAENIKYIVEVLDIPDMEEEKFKSLKQLKQSKQNNQLTNQYDNK